MGQRSSRIGCQTGIKNAATTVCHASQQQSEASAKQCWILLTSTGAHIFRKTEFFSFQDTVVLFQKLKLKSHDTETMFQKKLEVNGRKQSTLYLKMQCQTCQRKSCFKADTLPKIKTCE